ncbi:hypothetical protein GJ744_002237 [Endocarpon pusillum]|uniref:Uncharacterized protein n=1 Tax=Endocarpon pusillum TaxID=364733 RepID=A0A8H7E1B0_9EURO|nr:hypothetical protein GJ744_002237 [Endocarpon pusillum]
MQSWDVFPDTGNELLSQLLCMQRDGRLHRDDKLILIGHQLGYYLLKKALLEASNKEHRPEEERLLNMLEMIVMLGEPELHPNNQTQWPQLISECVSGGKPLSHHLANDRTLGSLEVISRTFEDACFTALNSMSDLVGELSRDGGGSSSPRGTLVALSRRLFMSASTRRPVRSIQWKPVKASPRYVDSILRVDTPAICS